MRQRQLLIASIGNAGKYLNTLHSIGHIAVRQCASTLQYPAWRQSGPYGGGLLAWPDERQAFALWQSPGFMNVSGRPVGIAWQQFRKDLAQRYGPQEIERARLVIVHDELENRPGTIRVREGGSARGHNGLKSCIQCLPDSKFWRIGIGIGRPQSREPEDVAAYVLRTLSAELRDRITQEAVPQILLALEEIAT